MTLVILAAGMGSRYGGLKQIDPIGPRGEFIIDYSCYDAIRAGYRKIIFVIKRENLELFRESVGKRIEGKADVRYAFQDLNDLPDGFSLPGDDETFRKKPWGTAHALLAAAGEIDGPFATINADDYYGPESYRIVAGYMSGADPYGVPAKLCMAGYRLSNTLTENGGVSRGICTLASDGTLSGIEECTGIEPDGQDAVIKNGDSVRRLPGGSVASMNFFGLTPGILDSIRRGFSSFLLGMRDPMKEEYYLPFALSEAVSDGLASIKVLDTPGKWFGVTYAKDRENVGGKIRDLVRAGVYPEDLWA